MYFFSSSAFLLVAAALAVAQNDFTGSYAGASSGVLSGSGFGGNGYGNNGFGGRVAAVPAATAFVPVSTGSGSGSYGRGGEDEVYGVQKTVTRYTTVRASDNGNSGYRGNFADNQVRAVAPVALATLGGNNGYSGNQGFGGNGVSSGPAVSTFSSLPAVLVAFPSLTGFSYGGFPSGNGNGNGLNGGNSGSGNVAYLPVVTVPTTAAAPQSNQGARTTNIVRTTVTSESERAAPSNQGSKGGLRAAAVVPGSYGRNAGFGGNAGSSGASAASASASTRTFSSTSSQASSASAARVN